MKETRPYVVIILASIFIGVFSPGFALAQRNDSNQTRSNLYFASAESCLKALESGTAKFYTPSFRSNHKPLRAGEEKVGLESDACVRMYTVRGFEWVAQKEGTEMVLKGKEIVRRWDCGNAITDVRYPEPEPDPIPTPTPFVPPACPEGYTPGDKPGLCLKTVPGERPPPIDNTCVPGAIRELLSYHEEKKGFTVAEIVRQKLPDKASDILALIGGGNERATSVIVMTDGCSVGVKTRNVIVKKDKWKWVWIAIAAGGGFAAGYFLRPGCSKCKTQTPVKSTPRTGSPTPQRPRRF